MKKGFTLVEVLAVIAILSAVALIVVPMIINIFSDTKNKANNESIELYAKAVEKAVVKYNLHSDDGIYGCFTTENGKTLKDLSTGEEITIDYDGEIACKNVIISKSGEVYLSVCSVNGKDVDYVPKDSVKNMLYNKKYDETEVVDKTLFLNSGIRNAYIKSLDIHTNGTNIANSNTYESKDCSMNQDGSVMCYWKEDSEDPGYYEFHIAADGEIYTPFDSRGLFARVGYYKMTSLDLTGINTKYTIDMFAMLARIGYTNMTTFSLGPDFDTSNAVNMRNLFYETGYEKMEELDLGDKFDTSNVESMLSMFWATGYEKMRSLNLGDKFDTSNVKTMQYMFYLTGYNSLESLDLKNKFDTSKVTDMYAMFASTGHESLKKLKLGNKFNTSNVTNMMSLFAQTGYNELESLDLGDKFDTSNVTDMKYIFYMTGSSKLKSLDLGDKFDTSKVTEMNSAFYHTGNNSMTYLRLGKKFDIPDGISNEKLKYIFALCGKYGNDMIVEVSSQTVKDKIKNLPEDSVRDTWKENDNIIIVK